MSRLKELRAYVDREIMGLENPAKIPGAIAHLYAVSMSANLLALRRGADPELCAMAAMLHDLHAYKSGSYEDHAHKGAELARKVLKELGLTTAEENEHICQAIYNHDDKLNVHGPIDEVLKDADVMHHCMNDLEKPVSEKEKARFAALKAELADDNDEKIHEKESYRPVCRSACDGDAERLRTP